MTELSSQYDSTGVEERIYKWWEESGFFAPRASATGKAYTIMMPPPNVTGILHMGHAFNVTYQDILMRWRRMNGDRALWIPGSDHAGIATQNVVERAIGKMGVTRGELGREKFIEKVWEWKKEHGDTISQQLRRLGASCDWKRERFTMDDGLSLAVRKVFVQLYKKGLIYRGEYIINWCPRCCTALSNEEVEHEETDGNLYYIRYPLKDASAEIVVATTRPETMLGDTAVAVHPDDERYSALKGRGVLLPIAGREIPVIADAHVDMEMGTGMVKVTPGHDPNDFEMGKRHSLPLINILNPDGTLNENAGEYEGMDCASARKRVVERLKSESLLEKVDPHSHMVGHCYRCSTIVEPYVSTQWFVKMKPLAEPALEAFRSGEYEFHPRRWEKIYLDWMENIRDWCISRQIWWGHRIPVWYCDECGELTVEMYDPAQCSHCKSSSIRRDEDVLDTWFSSWLWPFTTLGWPETGEDMRVFYPTNTMVTAHDIIFFWVARMIMAGLEFPGEPPFKDIYIHGMIRDDLGRKMSKSLGNTIDPLDVIEEFGADALRFSLISISAEGQDIYVSREKFHIGRNLANKIWNAARFLSMNLGDRFDASRALPSGDSLELADRWILSRLQRAAGSVDDALAGFRFNEAASLLYDFFWHDYCDVYVELAKERLTGEIADGRSEETGGDARHVAWFVLERVLRLFHPFMPFVTEELWQKIPHTGETLMLQSWPNSDGDLIDRTAEAEMEYLRNIVQGCLMLRGDYGVKSGLKAEGCFLEEDKAKRRVLSDYAAYITRLADISPLGVHAALEAPKQAARTVVGTTRLFIPLKGLIDVEKEGERLGREINRVQGLLNGLEKRLGNEEFLRKAPEDVVSRERSKRSDFREMLEKLEKTLLALEEGD